MSRMMIQAAVTMDQLQHKLDLIGNNMANSQTTGYKSREAEFSSLLFQQINNVSGDPENEGNRLTPEGIRVGSGAKLGTANLDFTSGTITETGRALDTALRGDNYFYQIQDTENDGEVIRYTRDGSFHLSPVNDTEDVMLTTSDGNPVLGQTGPIVMEDGFDSIDIQANGQIMVGRGDQTEVVGELDIVEVIRPQLLEATGDNNFQLPDLAELGFEMDEIIQATDPTIDVIQSNALERSNVDVSKQMTDLITAQRSYQFNAQTISIGDEMKGLINQLR
ncbi:flagellar basal-body rod protein FlgG [Virgibacillus natechei]|uniref:Flagellar basal-body rod protein FlgG n=1 Tax=Virgibacillus natechei TaxID=1216297 RepID=A0ABS4IL56_9BACI|nr:flagellar hook-basal body protein [Virgibacillus natechei]MBP1971682.1 flagellar basal-body rod protein FlgG [Virgibacillus natechei]UZD12571.1 flagellar hook-basal body protein [Virgibacillus natechei]